MTDVNFDHLMGWAGERWADNAWQDIGASFPQFKVAAATVPSSVGKTVRAWDIWRKVLGRDLARVVQETGDCVAASMNDVAMVQQCVDIFSGDRETFEPLLISYQYAHSRVIVGKNQLRGGAGSVGSWMAKTATGGGFLKALTPGVPSYSGKLSDRWGDDKDYNGITFRQFIDTADDHPLEKAIRVTSWTQLKDAVCNLNFGTIASDRGYEMKPKGGERGFHRPSGTWQHQMGILAISDEWIGISNQWGDQHGRLVDLITGEPWPIGMLRVTREDFEKYHLKSSAECFVYSGFRGFVDNSDLLDGLLI